MRTPLALLLLLASVSALGGLASPLQRTPTIQAGAGGRYGLVLDADRAFYSRGDTVKARIALVNASADLVGGWTPVQGDLGCSFTFRLEDSIGQVVWTPGSPGAGGFETPACQADPAEDYLKPGASLQKASLVPLVYNSPTAGALNGQPLPAGPYTLKAELRFVSPAHPRALFAEGSIPAAQLGILVE